MSDDNLLSPSVRVYMSEKEALWCEFEHGVSQQGSSSEGNPFSDIRVPGFRPKSEPDQAVGTLKRSTLMM